MSNISLWGWDYAVMPAVAQWRKLHVDAAGDLQVDVLTAGPTTGHCYGYLAPNWYELLVESAANPNLRTRLYDGVNPVVSVGTGADIADTNRGLLTQAGVRGWDGAFWKSVNVEDAAGDALANARASLSVVSKLYGYNGATWDRLRVGSPADAYTTPTFALEVMSFLMGYDGVDWNMVRVNAAGRLQIDIVSSALPALAATAANQATIIGHIDGIEGALGNCYGWDTAAWIPMEFEAVDVPNLRVKLYDGANGIDSTTLAVVPTLANRALITAAHSFFYNNDTAVLTHWLGYDDADAVETRAGPLVQSRLFGYNGATWDRLRVYTTGILKVGRAEIDSTTVRVTAAGAVVGGAHNIYWISCSPDSPGAEFELTDAIAGGGAVVFDHFDPDKHSEVIHLDPPMKFATGIWVEKFDHIKSLVFCYV